MTMLIRDLFAVANRLCKHTGLVMFPHDLLQLRTTPRVGETCIYSVPTPGK